MEAERLFYIISNNKKALRKTRKALIFLVVPKAGLRKALIFLVVPKAGLEPARRGLRLILSQVRLPIPPLRQLS